ncbi:MAG: hypothetical protein JNJ89_18020 [Rubrivivax sp.]|nr:hypothetical protein [Rubrivivax sp.]
MSYRTLLQRLTAIAEGLLGGAPEAPTHAAARTPATRTAQAEAGDE